MTRRADLVLAVYGAALAALALGPLLGGGYLLLRDAVSTPRSYLTDAALGLGGNAARATPQDWLIAVASHVVDGGVAVTAILFVSLAAAAWGYGRCAVAVCERAGLDVGLPGALAAATVAVWNPFVAERLLQGHWSLLAGYAAVGWTVVVALRMRGVAQAGALACCLAAGGLTPTGAMYVLVTALILVRRRVLTLILFVVAAAPWLYPSLVASVGLTVDRASVGVFAARAETGLGTLGSLAGLGGIWNAQAVPPGRDGVGALLGTALLLLVVVSGLVVLRLKRLRGLVGLAVVAVLLPASAATPLGSDALAAVVTHVPGGGILRDTQKWVALAAPLYCSAAAAAVCAAVRWAPQARGPIAVLVGALAVVALPGLAWGVSRNIAPTHYPAAWREVASRVPAGDGAVAVLPTGMFRRFAYGPAAPVLDPAPRMLAAPVLQTGELKVGDQVIDRVPGPAADAEEALITGGPGLRDRLAGLGVRWVLVEASPAMPNVDLAGLQRVYHSDALQLWQVPGTVSRPAAATGPERAGAWAAHLLWLATLLGGAGAAAVRRHETAPEAAHPVI
ncbi:hypothetical protein P0W64_17905 [Tsukamurella sp. 8F]|uniref:hypothetical protein n=1 Tax=unclassified Tsukamurella TaxID=2633480 RepID=UPI0023BA104B|nr:MULTISPECIES: hypothetical protein [unclassified Tsukamurella]MDF0529884.1 hypothetical protein [Tsukamurella sp. 8J]MDF0588661.1 hypothetical protein [Tsukamurella sp. 8F]